MSQSQRVAHFFCAKSCVALLKSLPVPKLELCAAVLLAQLMQEVLQHGLFSCPVDCLSDSAVVLSWIRNECSRFQTFISNRISLIQELARILSRSKGSP